MYTKQQSMIDLNKQMEEIRFLYEKLSYERKQQCLQEVIASLESSWNSQIHIQEFNSSPSNTITVYPEPSKETMKNIEPETMKKYDPFIEPLKDDSALQVLDSVPDVLMVHKADSHVKEVEELPQKSTGGKHEKVAHQLFDEMPSKEKRIKHLKGWRFKFKPDEVTVEGISNKPVNMIQDGESTSDNESRSEVLVSQLQVPLSSMEPSRRCRNVSLDVVDELMCNELVCEEDGDSIITMSTEFSQTYEEPRFELVSLEQSHDPVENHLDNSKSALISSSIRHIPTYQYRAPFNPYQNCIDQCHYKREFGNYTEPGIEFDIASEEVEDDELQDKQPEDEAFGVNVETLVMNEDKQPLECDDEKNAVTSSILRLVIPVIVEHVGKREKDYDGALLALLDDTVAFSNLDAQQLRKQQLDPLLMLIRMLVVPFSTLILMTCKVLELNKDKASKKRKLCKNWWFKYKLNTWLSEAFHFWKYKKQINQGQICLNGLCNELVYGIEKKKLMNVEGDIIKDQKLDHNLIALNLQICCRIGGLSASGFEMETWTVKKSLEWLNKLTIAISLAQMFLDHICKLQGTPQDRLSDKNSTFLIELFRVLRADLTSDTTYEFIFVQPHPVHFPFGLEETSFAFVMDRSFQKKEELIAMSTVHLSRGLVQWKEHPPDHAT